MSEDRLRRTDAEETASLGPDGRLGPLLAGQSSDEHGTRTEGPALGEDRIGALEDDLEAGPVPVADGLVTESLDEILLGLIGSANGETHGTELMDALDRQFDVQLSPGTVYPRLHDLESADLLERHELVRTKQYALREESTARDAIERTASQHLALSLFLFSTLEGF